MKLTQLTANLIDYPNMVVIYFGMVHDSFKGVQTILKVEPQIHKVVTTNLVNKKLMEGSNIQVSLEIILENFINQISSEDSFCGGF